MEFYVSSAFLVKRRRDLEVNELELLWIEMKVNSLTFLCSVYRLPSDISEINIKFLENLQCSVDRALLSPQNLLYYLLFFLLYIYFIAEWSVTICIK